MTRSDRQLLAMGLAVLAALIVSGIKPYDRVTWILEVAPVLIALSADLPAEQRRWKQARLTYFSEGKFDLAYDYGK